MGLILRQVLERRPEVVAAAVRVEVETEAVLISPHNAAANTRAWIHIKFEALLFLCSWIFFYLIF